MRTALIIAALSMAAVACTESTSDTTLPGDSAPIGETPEIPGVGEVILVGPPETNAGRAPQFEWDAVPGAAGYRLVVVDAADVPIWTWAGDATAVWMGGFGRELPVGLSEPVLQPGSSWSVVAYDDAGSPIAISGRRSVSPGDDTTAPGDDTTTTAPNASPSTTTTTTPETGEIADPCEAVDLDLVASLLGQSAPGEPLEISGGGQVIGKSCSWPAGSFNPPLRIGIYSTSVSSFVDLCSYCEEVTVVGDAAWGGRNESGAGATLVSLYVEEGGLGYTIETLGIEVDVEALIALYESARS